MTKNNNNSNRGLPALVGIVILGLAIYYNNSGTTFAKYKTNTNTNSNITSTYNKPQGGGCGGGAGGCGGGSAGGAGGCNMGGNSRPTSTTSTPTNNTTDQNVTYETVQVSEDGSNTVPEKINLTAGKNYKLIITPTSDGLGCKYAMTIPGIDNNAYDIKKDIPITITINNAKSGNYNIVCTAMGMYIGTIIVQ